MYAMTLRNRVLCFARTPPSPRNYLSGALEYQLHRILVLISYISARHYKRIAIIEDTILTSFLTKCN